MIEPGTISWFRLLLFGILLRVIFKKFIYSGEVQAFMDFVLIGYFLIVVVGLVALWKSGDFVVRYTVEVAETFNVSTFFIGFIVLAMAADIPELAVAIISACKGVSEVSAGDIIGANFADAAMVIGFTLLLANKPLSIRKEDSQKLVKILSVSALVIILACMLGKLYPYHGLILIAIYFIAVIWVWKTKHKKDFLEQEGQALTEELAPAKGVITPAARWLLVAKLLASLGFVMGASFMTVQGAIYFAMMMNLPLETIGATILAIGTSLPELSLSLNALRRKEYGLVLAPTLATVLEQTTLILGVLTLASHKPVNMRPLIGAAGFMLVAFALVGYGLYRHNQVGRKTGIALVSLFFVYLGYQAVFGGFF